MQTLTRLFGSMWSGLVTGLIIGTAIVVPVVTDAQTSVVLQGSLRAANVTAGDADYKETVSADANQLVKLQVYYANSSKDTADKVQVKIAMPEQAGNKQIVNATIKGSNTNELTDQVAVSVTTEQAVLQYVPGTAVWKHNTASEGEPKIEETKISDNVVVGAQGVTLESQKPGEDYGSTITVQARVMLPGVKVSQESEVKGQANKWSSNNTAKPTDTMRYIVSYQNTSSTQQKQVVARSTLPDKMQLVSGTTMLYNSSNPNGVKVDNDSVTGGGVVIGNYGPGANAYVMYEATFAAGDQLACGSNEFRSIGLVKPESMAEYFGSAVTTVNRDCASKSNEAATPKPVAAYSCDLLTLTKGDGRKASAKVDYTAKDGASLKMVKYDFGDGSETLSTDKTNVEHAFAKDGTYTVTATLIITANGKDQSSTSAACSKQVTFAPAATPPASPSSTATDLPNSGPGSVAGLFVAASAIGFVVHRLVIGRARRIS